MLIEESSRTSEVYVLEALSAYEKALVRHLLRHDFIYVSEGLDNEKVKSTSWYDIPLTAQIH